MIIVNSIISIPKVIVREINNLASENKTSPSIWVLHKTVGIFSGQFFKYRIDVNEEKVISVKQNLDKSVNLSNIAAIERQ